MARHNIQHLKPRLWGLVLLVKTAFRILIVRHRHLLSYLTT